ncbi:MAG: hypothetical protein HY698_15260 [Deltaproteobacteria bacterium]|nr:hypothetical protein [Deltaproteobacteria bacterium]
MRLSSCLGLALPTALGLLGCSAERTGPTPSVAGLSPSLACGEQLTTTITISGAGLSPLAIEAATKSPKLAIPDVILKRTQDLAGASVGGSAVTIPNDPSAPSAARVKWMSETEMAIDIYPELALAPGLYQITVANRNGRAFTKEAALTVVPRPMLAAVEPDLLCVAQSDRSVTIRGEGFLQVGDALPKVHFDGLERPVESLSDCTDLPGPTAAKTCKTATATIPKVALAPGAPALVLTNPSPAACKSEDKVEMAIVPAPTLAKVQPDLFCSKQKERTLTLTGTGFVRLKDELPSVMVGETIFRASSASGCTRIEGTKLAVADSCTELTVVIPKGGVDPSVHDVMVVNPQPAGCRTLEEVTVVDVPPPRLEKVVPDLACVAEEARTLTLSGQGFLEIDGSLPEVTIGTEVLKPVLTVASCSPLTGTLTNTKRCTEMTVTVTKGLLGAGKYEVSVTNPLAADCTSEESVTMAVTPPPKLASIVEDLTCLADGEKTFTLSGTDFVKIGEGLPTVDIGGKPVVPSSASECTAIDGTLTGALACKKLSLTLPPGAIDVGSHDVTVTNPQPAGCSSIDDVKLVVVPEPTVASVIPDLSCAALGVTAEVKGTGFLVVDTALPTVLIGTTPVLAASVDEASCQVIPGTLHAAKRCTSLSVVVPPGVDVGTQNVRVKNPAPADCTSNETVPALVVAAPLIESVAPEAVCNTAQPASMVIKGANFLRIGGTLPTVEVDGVERAVTGATCTPITGIATVADSCTELTFAVPAPGFAAGNHKVKVLNPAPAGCATAALGSFDVTSAPKLDPVATPQKVCSAGGQFTVTGTGFVAGSQIILEGTSVPTDFTTSSSISGTLSPGLVPADLYDVTVENGQGCADTVPDAVRVVDQPTIFFADPPVVYNGVNLQITIFASGITGTVTAAGIRPTGSTADPTTLKFEYRLSRPNRVLATIPKDTPAGIYDVLLRDETCGAVLEQAVRITETLSVDVARIDPPFGTEAEDVGVAIRSAVPPAVGKENFKPTPRAYLNPTSQGATALATEIRAVAYLEPGKITGVVPGVLDAGTYDLIVVNPDGGVGLLAEAFTVVVEPPPLITELSPNSLVGQSGQKLKILGTNFRDPLSSVKATCRKATGDVELTATVGTTTATSIDTTWDMSTVTAGDACVVRVTNSDGTYADFSAVSITNSSLNLASFKLDADMVVPRRALAAAAIRMNSASRFLFAIGGDSGAGTEAHSSVEAAPVDEFGDVGTWALQRNSLPQGRSHVTAQVVGRYAYLAGGRVGNQPSSSVLRAYLLDPKESPEVLDVDLTRSPELGLGGGTWYYRVAAVMQNSDSNNPGGEGLPSEPLVVQVPSLKTGRVHVTITWTAVAGADKYRIYRTPEANQILGKEVLLDTVSASKQSYTDTGVAPPADAPGPLPLGSLGTWHSVGTLNSAREGAAVLAVPKQGSPDTVYLFVVGGLKDATALASIERATITVSSSSQQVVGAFGVLAATLPRGRWQHGAVYVDQKRASAVAAGDVWVYVLPGAAADGTATVGDVDAFSMSSAGDLTRYTAATLPTNDGFAGYGFVAGNHQIYLLGSQNGQPSATGNSTEVCDGTRGCSGPPKLRNWNAGFALKIARYLHATAVESSFIYQLGGTAIVDSVRQEATRTTERTSL